MKALSSKPIKGRLNKRIEVQPPMRDKCNQKNSYRVAAMVDSYVTRGAVSKGRSSSRASTALVRQIDVELIIGGAYMVTPYIPTRLNCADDPTRLHKLRGPITGLSITTFEEEDIYRMGLLKGTRRWASNWVRLALLLMGPYVLLLKDHSLFRRRYSMDFDSTLGFPGEGPYTCMLWILSSLRHRLDLLAKAFFTPSSPPSPFYFLLLPRSRSRSPDDLFIQVAKKCLPVSRVCSSRGG